MTGLVRQKIGFYISVKNTHTDILGPMLHMTLFQQDVHSHASSLTGRSGSYTPRQCPHSDTRWPAAPPPWCRKPMRTGCGPSPPPPRHPPSWTDSSCFHWATQHIRRAEISSCVICVTVWKLSHLAVLDKLIVCVSVSVCVPWCWNEGCHWSWFSDRMDLALLSCCSQSHCPRCDHQSLPKHTQLSDRASLLLFCTILQINVIFFYTFIWFKI